MVSQATIWWVQHCGVFEVAKAMRRRVSSERCRPTAKIVSTQNEIPLFDQGNFFFIHNVYETFFLTGFWRPAVAAQPEV